jgi:long-chain fatty acid transport protein
VKKLVTLVCACVIATSNLFAGGFQLNEHGARAMAMAGAFTGLANDPSAVFFNPAGITQLDGTKFYAGSTLILPMHSYTSPAPMNSETETLGQTFAVINFYATHKLSDRISIGVGVNNQYGLGTKWDANWVGKYLALETNIKSFFFTPVIAVKILDNLSISGGATIAMANVLITNKVKSAIGGTDPLVTLEADYTTAIGFTAGILWKPTNKLQIGAAYRSESTFDFSGTVTSDPASFVHPTYKINIPYPNGSASASLTTPQNLSVGLAFMPNDAWTIAVDGQYVGWSSYGTLEITLHDYNAANPTVAGSTVESAKKDWQDTYILRLGFEYKASDNFALRFGVLYDHNPVKTMYVDPSLPDADRIGYNIGFGGKLTEHLLIDFAYLYEVFKDRNVSGSYYGLNGTYKNIAHLFALNFGYSL